MELLKERIMQDGKCYPGGILKVDSFINHQMDSNLMMEIAKEFVRLFKDKPINKVVTIEASGIAPAIFVGYLMHVPVVFIKKKQPNAAKGVIDLCQKAGATIEGMGFIIEKAFQQGGDFLRSQGIYYHALATVESLDNCEIKLRD